jgi:hypothetical protein
MAIPTDQSDADVEKRIIDDIGLSYGSSGTPNYSFAAKRLKAGLHEDLIRALMNLSEIQETTDLNYDVSRALFMHGPDEEIALRLSLVGKYASLHTRDGRLLDENSARQTSLGRNVLSTLVKAGITVLSPQLLRRDVPLGDERVSVFNALFFDEGGT